MRLGKSWYWYWNKKVLRAFLFQSTATATPNPLRPYDPIPFPNVDGFSRAGEEDQDDTSGSAALTRG